MPKKITLLLLCSFLFAMTAYAAVSGEELAKGRALLQTGPPQDAYSFYLRLLREEPDNPEVNLGLARAALAAGHPNQAIMAYERLIAVYPGETAFYREIAQAYLVLGDKETAMRYLQNDTSLSGDAIRIMIDSLGKRYERLQMRGQIRAGVLYDSNANSGPSSDRLDFGIWKDVRVDNVKGIHTLGAYLGGQADMAYRTAQDSPTWIVGDAGFYMRGSLNSDLREMHSRYSQWYRVAGGVRHLSEKRLLDFRLKAEVFDYDFLQTVYSCGPEITFAQVVHPRFQLITRGGVEGRRYVRNSNYDGNYLYLGQYARFFFGKAKHEFMLGGRYNVSHSDYDDYSYKGWEASASFRLKLPHGFEFSPNISYSKDRYKGPAVVLEDKDRRDERIRSGFSLVYRVSEKFSVEGTYQYTRNLSNSDLYKYDRHLVTLGSVWTF